MALNLSPSGLAQIPPSILNTIPALQPPAGVESNFINPEDRGYILNSVATVLLCLAVCLFAIRIYTRFLIVRKAGWDDLTCTTGFLGTIGLYIVAVRNTVSGVVGKHQWDVRLVDLTSGSYLKSTAALDFLSPVSLCLIKLTFFLLYFQVFRPLRWLRISVYIGATLTCAFYGASAIAEIIFAVPSPGQTWIEHTFSRQMDKGAVLSIPLAAVGLGIDLVLLVIPVVAVIGLQLPTGRKLGIIFIFMFGIFACIGSLLSIYYRVVSRRSSDFTWTIMPVNLLALVESFIGISCACMPSFSKMLHHHHPTLEKFRSLLSMRFAGLRSRDSRDIKDRSGLSQPDVPDQYAVGISDRGLYRHFNNELPARGGPTDQPTYVLGQLQSVQTIIGKGLKKRASDDKIHLTHEIQQQRVRTP